MPNTPYSISSCLLDGAGDILVAFVAACIVQIRVDGEEVVLVIILMLGDISVVLVIIHIVGGIGTGASREGE